MTGTIEIASFMDYLEKNDLVITPRALVEERLQDAEIIKLRKAAKRAKALTYKEIADAKLWGDIATQGVKAYAGKYAKEGEIFEVKMGRRPLQKIVITAVERIAKQRGQLWD